MHESRVARSGRAPLAVGVGLLLILLLLSIFYIRDWKVFPSALPGSGEAVSSSAPPISPAETARRVAIAALGPMKMRTGLNAADLYKQASELYSQLTPAQRAMLMDWDGKQDPKAAAALFAKIQPIMDLLRRARKAAYVDWGMPPPKLEPLGDDQARFGIVNQLGVLAYWEAQYRFQSDPDGAVGDLAARDALAGAGVDDGIGMVLQCGGHENAVILIAQNIAGVASAAEPDLAQFTNPAVSAQAFQSGVDGHASMLQAFLNEYANPATRDEAEPFIHALMDSASRKGQPISAGEAVSELQWMESTEQALATTATEPDAQFKPWFSQTRAQAASMPGLAVVDPFTTIGAMRSVAQESMAQGQMLAAAIALEQGGQAQFQSIADPYTGQPFTYTQTPTGFKLTSSVMYAGQPVSLSFSTGAK